MTDRPTLLHSCAFAATKREVSYRIDAQVDLRRSTRIIALDGPAAAVVRRVSDGEWSDARFLVVEPATQAVAEAARGADLVLVDTLGEETHLSEELATADSVVMVATEGSAPSAVRTIGEAATLRGIMTAGVVFGDVDEVRAAVSTLRPYARVLLVSRDDDDVAEVLTALRA